MKKQFFAYASAVLCVLLCACEATAPAEITESAAAVTTTVYAEATDAATASAPPAEEPGIEYAILQNADGKEIGVLFTYPDGSTYQWNCPAESPLPLFIRIEEKKDKREACVIEYYIGDGEWRFDWLDLADQKLLYRHVNEEGREFVFRYDNEPSVNPDYRGTSRQKYTFYTRTGVIDIVINQETGAPETAYRIIHPNNDSGIYQNHCIPVKEVIIAETGERAENNSPYTHLYSVAGEAWYLKDEDTFYEDIHYIDGEWRWDIAEPRPRLTGFSALYYFKDGVPAPEEDCFYATDNVSGYTVWSGYEYEHMDMDPSVSRVYWVRIDEHYATQIAAYMYDPDDSMYNSWNAEYFIRNLFYYE